MRVVKIGPNREMFPWMFIAISEDIYGHLVTLQFQKKIGGITSVPPIPRLLQHVRCVLPQIGVLLALHDGSVGHNIWLQRVHQPGSDSPVGSPSLPFGQTWLAGKPPLIWDVPIKTSIDLAEF